MRILLFICCLLTVLPLSAQKTKKAKKNKPESAKIYSVFDPQYQLLPFDLEKSLSESRKNKADGKPSSYTPIMLDEFLRFYYPDTKFDWVVLDVGHYFGYKGIRISSEVQWQEMYVSWQSFSDGLEWCFFNTDLTRSLTPDPFDVIDGVQVNQNIKTYLANKNIWSEKNASADKPDVFLYKYRKFCTDQKTENIPFEPAGFTLLYYGVYIGGKTYYFSLLGDFDSKS